MREQGRHLDQGLPPPEVLAIVFELLRLADIAQDENRSRASLTLLQPGVADGNPDGFGAVRTRLLQPRLFQPRLLQTSLRQFELFARLACPVERDGERGRQCVGRLEAAAEQASRLGIESRNPRSGFDRENAARQGFQNAAQAFADAVVFFETSRQVAVGDFQFLAEMRYLPLQLPVGTLERTRRLGE